MAVLALTFGIFYAGCAWGFDGALRRSIPLRALYPLGLKVSD